MPAHELESWKRVFLEQGTRGLRIRGEPEERELTRAMKGRVSRATQRPYPLTLICAVCRVARSSVYAVVRPTPTAGPARKPGPKSRAAPKGVLAQLQTALPDSLLSPSDPPSYPPTPARAKGTPGQRGQRGCDLRNSLGS